MVGTMTATMMGMLNGLIILMMWAPWMADLARYRASPSSSRTVATMTTVTQVP